MKVVRVSRGERIPAGVVLTRDAGKLPKGRLLSEADAKQLVDESITELHALALEAGDVHEDAAGRRLAEAAAGQGAQALPPAQGSFPIAAKHRGLVMLQAARLAQVNLIDDLALYAHPEHMVVAEGEVIARAKVVPFVTREERVQKAEELARGAIAVRPFLPLRCALLVQEELQQAALDRARECLQEKLAFFGGKLQSARIVAGIEEALREEIARGAELILIAGSRSMDPLDPVMSSLRPAGAELVRHGVPAFPGTLLWLAYLGQVPLVGAPGCGIFTRRSSLDLLLPRLFTGERLGPQQIAELAVGGLLTPEISYKLAPYKAGVPRGQLE